MSEKFTPGPWRFYTNPQPNGCPIVGSKGLMVAMLAHSVKYADQRDVAIGNAHLIAAAPDLYFALEKTCANALELGYCAMQDCTACQNKAVLKKARGEE